MSAPYRSKGPTVFELLEDLEAAGRSRSAACTELSNMIRDRAVALFDFHRPAASDEWLIGGACEMIGSFRLNAPPPLWTTYFKQVFVDRAQFEAAAGIQRNQEAHAAANGAERAKTARPPTANQRALLDAIKECFPQGVPKDVDMPNGAVSNTLASWLKVHRPAVAKMSDKTILRAAGRAR
jgi:hypothetical protein